MFVRSEGRPPGPAVSVVADAMLLAGALVPTGGGPAPSSGVGAVGGVRPPPMLPSDLLLASFGRAFSMVGSGWGEAISLYVSTSRSGEGRGVGGAESGDREDCVPENFVGSD